MRQLAKDHGMNRESMRRLVKRDLGFRAFKMKTVQLLTNDQKKKRLDRSKTLRRRYTHGAHQRILFSDEKIFTIEQFLNNQNDRILARRSDEVDKDVKNVARTQKPKQVMVWAGFIGNQRLPLVFVPDGVKLNAHSYIQHILEGVVKPWTLMHPPHTNFDFQQDGAPSHMANMTQDWLRDNLPGFIEKTAWPPSSLDLNPLDFSLWSILESKVCASPHRNLDSLKRDLQREWERIPGDILRKSTNSFYSRLLLCIKAKGGHFE